MRYTRSTRPSRKQRQCVVRAAGRGRVEGVRVGGGGARLGEPDERGNAPDPVRDPRQRLRVRLEEVPLQVEVLGRVSGQGQLGKDHEVGALLARTTDPFRDQARVLGEGPDGGIDLGECQAQSGYVAHSREVCIFTAIIRGGRR